MFTALGAGSKVGAVAELEKWRTDIRDARMRQGLSRRQAALKAGISEGAWRNVETGQQHIAGVGARAYRTTPTTVAKMAAAVKLDPRAVVVAAGLDPDEVYLDTVPGDAQQGDVRIIVIRGTPTTDEVLEEVRRLLEGQDES
jgi:transcriptional regulator with XRE-family HTH domain